VARKGYDLLIDAVGRLPRHAKLVLIGSGPESAALLRQVRESRLENRVLLAGRVDERRKYGFLAAADCYVLSSHHEGFGIVLQEAMAAGLPIAATREGGQTDLLKDGTNAVLMDSNRPGEMASAIGRLMDDEPLRRAMSQANRRDVLHYGAASIATAYIDVFESVVRHRRGQKLGAGV
jgi:glycosyltransferase involved in cell wall biosynthesis